MPFPSFSRPPQRPQPPRPEDSPASISSSRFGALHNNVRSMINGSSVYSNSPEPSNNGTPKIGFLGFLRREQTPPAIVLPDERLPRGSTSSRSPILAQHTAGSYMREIVPTEQHPIEPQLAHTRQDSYGSIDPETEHLANEVQRRQRRHRRRRKPQQRRAWVRRKSERGVCFSFVQNPAARSKCTACLISGLFLMTVLSIYLSLALTRPRLGQEIHVLFIMIILCTTIFFCHSLIRLCMLALRPETEEPRIPSMTGPEGFHPVRPIRVHLARDEEMEVGNEQDETEMADAEKSTALKAPPPAYGLWRSSVRVNPDLLHWQRVDDVSASGAASANRTPASTHPNSRSGSFSGTARAPEPQNNSARPHEEQGPRPPSYVSDDGVEYVVAAAPRSVAPSMTGLSDVHPAWRPGFAF